MISPARTASRTKPATTSRSSVQPALAAASSGANSGAASSASDGEAIGRTFARGRAGAAGRDEKRLLQLDGDALTLRSDRASRGLGGVTLVWKRAD